ncbi:hypothetical protein SD78_1372 [Bacillus badius]|nr:hypothetical protein SD78_1372 [Bacillus badius]
MRNFPSPLGKLVTPLLVVCLRHCFVFILAKLRLRNQYIFIF